MPLRSLGRDERGAGDCRRPGLQAAAAALAVLERHLGKTVLRSPVDGIVSVIVAEIGENVRAGQPVLGHCGSRQAVAVVQTRARTCCAA